MELFTFNSSLFWFILGVVFLVLEILVPGFFLIFFGLGAWATASLMFFMPVPINMQWAIFIIVSVSTLLILRRRLKDILKKGPSPVGAMDDPIFANQYLNREVLVVQDIAPGSPGLVELNGTNWQAISKDSVITAGKMARVLSINGLTLLVTNTD